MRAALTAILRVLAELGWNRCRLLCLLLENGLAERKEAWEFSDWEKFASR